MLVSRRRDAERQTALSAENYLNRALRMLAERLGWEKLLENDPAGFAVRFAPLLAALIEAQAREYQSWVFYERLGEVADASRDALGDLANVLSERLDRLMIPRCPAFRHCGASRRLSAVMLRSRARRRAAIEARRQEEAGDGE